MVTSRRHTAKLLTPLTVAAKDRFAGRLMTQDPATGQVRGETVGTLLAPTFNQRTPAERGVHVIEFRPATRIFPPVTIGARSPARLPSELTQE